MEKPAQAMADKEQNGCTYSMYALHAMEKLWIQNMDATWL